MSAKRDNLASERQRIVVTGLGIVSPLGIDVETFWRRLSDPAAEAGETERASAAGAVAFSGQLEEFGPPAGAARRQLAKSIKLMNRETQLGVAAGLQALEDSRLAGVYDPERTGILFGAGNVCVAPEDFRSGVQACTDAAGELDASLWGARGLEEMAPLWLLRCLPNMPACHLAILADLRGANNTITQRQLGADLAIAEACRILRDDDADAILVGATGTTLTGLNRLHARWSATPENDAAVTAEEDGATACFPAEGAAAFVLEHCHAAKRRGARIYGEILAAVSVSGGRGAVSQDAVDVESQAIRETLRRSRLDWSDLGHMHVPVAAESTVSLAAHGLPWIDARRRCGDAGAGSGAIELAASLLALHHGRLFASSGDELACGRGQSAVADAPAGNTGLKLNRLGRRQATCLALARVPA